MPTTELKVQPDARPHTNVHVCLTACAVFIVTLVLVRWSWLQGTVVDIPFWDQWDAIVDRLFVPLHEGTFSLKSLLALQNEHRVFWTRLVNTLVYLFNNGRFDNRVVTAVNAWVYAGTLALLLWPVLRASGMTIVCLAAGLIIGALPYAWENIPVGLQNAFYFLNFFAIAAIYVASHGELARGRLTILIGLCFCSLFTLASGVLTPCAVLAIISVRFFAGDMPRPRFTWALILLGACIAVGVFLIGSNAGHGALRPDSIAAFLAAWMTTLAWPLGLISPWFAFVFWAPAAWCVVRLAVNLRAQQQPVPVQLYLLALAAWVAMQCAAIAYSRGAVGHVASRYADTLVLGGFCNLLLLFSMIDAWIGSERRRQFLVVCTTVFAALFGLGMVSHSAIGYLMLEHRAALGVKQTMNLKQYLASGSAAALASKPGLEISYPSATRLMTLLESNAVLDSLPPSIAPALFTAWPHCAGYEPGGTYSTVRELAYPPGATGTWAAPKRNGNVESCRSGWFQVDTPYLSFYTSGYLGRDDMSVTLVSASGQSMPLDVDKSSRESWSATMVKVEPGKYHVKLDDASVKYWFAIAPPQPIGQLSAWAHYAISHSRGWLATWALLVLVGALLLALLRHRG